MTPCIGLPLDALACELALITAPPVLRSRLMSCTALRFNDSVASYPFLAVKPSVSGFLGFDAALFRENRARLAAALKDAKVPAGSVVVLQGSPEVNRDDTGEIGSVKMPAEVDPCNCSLTRSRSRSFAGLCATQACV